MHSKNLKGGYGVQNSCLHAGGKGPNSLFNVDNCFWIIQDSNMHRLDVWGQVYRI